jgi:hypothetical protein
LTAGTPGVLTPKEFEAAALRIMPELKPQQLRRLFKELDRDRDGYIDFLGFLQVSPRLVTSAIGRQSGVHPLPAAAGVGNQLVVLREKENRLGIGSQPVFTGSGEWLTADE